MNFATALEAVNKEAALGHPTYVLEKAKIRFLFDPAAYGQIGVSSVEIRASFTAWRENPYRFIPGGVGDLWSLSLDRSLVDVPGNSGQPEYKFVVNGSEWISGAGEPEGYHFFDNFVVLWETDRREAFAAKVRGNSHLKKSLSDFSDLEELSNFRTIEAGPVPKGRLFRSYHPFLGSKPIPIEADRVRGAETLLEEHAVAAVINLADEPETLRGRGVPSHYRDLAFDGQVLFSPTSYETVYFAPDSPEFARTINEVLSFVADRKGPFLVHCRLGTDRTGVVTGLLSAIAGVPWQDIARDYVKSNALGIREYRDERLLAHSFAKMTGRSPDRNSDFNKDVRQFVLRMGVPPGTLEKAIQRLTAPLENKG